MKWSNKQDGEWKVHQMPIVTVMTNQKKSKKLMIKEGIQNNSFPPHT